MGEIERRNDFEGRQAIGTVGESGLDDYVAEDSALAYRCPDGLVVIVGCAHAGICNIVQQAQAICGDERVLDIIGGCIYLTRRQRKYRGQRGSLTPCNLEIRPKTLQLENGPACLRQVGEPDFFRARLPQITL